MQRHSFFLPVLLTVIVFASMSSGCTSTASSHAITTVPAGAPPASPSTAITTQEATAVPTTTGESFLTYYNPSYQLTISYPADWQRKEADPATCWALRDYGKITCNIVNFTSPDTTDGSYRTFSINVDNVSTISHEKYFTQMTQTLENTYTGLQIIGTTTQDTISNERAFRIYFRKGNGQAPCAIEDVTFTQNNIPYIISYNSMEDTQFDTMVHSLQISQSLIPGHHFQS